jgi:protein-tyrosine-phosphatase
MAQGFLQHYLGDNAVVCSSGSKPGELVNEVAVIAMKEKGIDISGAYPKPLDSTRFCYLNRAVTMGCGDVCPLIPNVTIEDWKLEDPRGADLDTVRGIRDVIEERVKCLCRELDPSFN